MITFRFHQLANKLLPIQTPIRLIGVLALITFAVLVVFNKDSETELLVCAFVILWSLVLNLIISGFRYIPTYVPLRNNVNHHSNTNHQSNVNHQSNTLLSNKSPAVKKPPKCLKTWLKNKLWRFYLFLLTIITLMLLGATLFLSVRIVNFTT